MLATLTQAVSSIDPDNVPGDDRSPSIGEITGVLENLTQLIYTSSLAKADNKFSPAEATELGEYAIYIVSGSEYMLQQAQKNSLAQHNNILLVGLALWIDDHGGEIAEPEKLVDIMAELANQTTDIEDMTAIFHILGNLINACSMTIKQDTDKSDTNRPWRVLNLNRCIVATRTHDPAIMEQAFTDLITNLAEDAADFFAQGIQQVRQPGYPQAARQVMQRYHDRYNPPVTTH